MAVVQLRPPPEPEVNIGELILLFLETRDAKAALEKKQKQHLKQYTDVLARIEATLFKHLQDHGGQSLSSDIGTAYLSHRRSASIKDAVQFKGYVIENRAWDMLDWKANVTAVIDFMTEHTVLPPGVDLKTDVKLNVMRK